MKLHSISKKLLANVLSVYFVLTFVVTCGQILAEYISAKSHIAGELRTQEHSVSGSLTRAIWELNTEQSDTIAEGLLAIPVIEGIVVEDEHGVPLTQMGRTLSQDIIQQSLDNSSSRLIEDQKSGLFGYNFSLIFEFSGRATVVGNVTLFSSRDVIFSRIQVGIYFLIGNAMIKTAFLIFLFLLAFRKHLTEPLAEMTEQMHEFDIDDLESSKIDIYVSERNEIKVLEEAYNSLIVKLQEFKDKLSSARQDLVQANMRLDDQNLLLEQEVAKKTSNLSQAMLDMERQKNALELNEVVLREEIAARSKTENALKKKQVEQQKSLDDLRLAQDRLLESEKMASLGGLVAGISHDVNTPVGIGVTAASYLDDRIRKLNADYESKNLSPSGLEAFIKDAQKSTELILSNLERASELIASFKQIAVDQTSEAVREVNLSLYVDEIINSLTPKLKQTQHNINVNCTEGLIIKCPAGAISQIFTNMIMNSLIHGFEFKQDGNIDINVTIENDTIKIVYADDGKGLTEKQKLHLFDPFFTTKRGSGGSGLGTHILYNLVTQTLNGNIEIESEPEKGLIYYIDFPATR